MLRWSLLAATFVVWAAMMWLIYREYGPVAPTPQALSSTQALEALFGERSAGRQSWGVYVDLRQLAQAQEGPPPNPYEGGKWEGEQAELLRAAQRAGARPGEIHIGTLAETVRRREETRAEVVTQMRLQLPAGYSTGLLQLLGELWYESRANFSRGLGLEDFSTKCSAGLGIEVIALGYREGDRLKMVTSAFAGRNKKVLEQHHEQKLSGASAPTLGLSPFFARPGIRLGDHWQVATLDTTSASGEARLVAFEARVVRNTRITYHGKQTAVFEVQAQQGRQKAAACYAPDGRVLVQHWRFADLLDLTLVRDEEP